MEELTKIDNRNSLEKLLDNKGKILIFLGVAIRIFMLVFYYYLYAINPTRDWGDIRINFNPNTWKIYPPVSVTLLAFFKLLSFGMIEIFAFWGFFLDLFSMILFYFVLKSFNIPHKERAYGLFFINPFLFLNNVFSLENCGYHLTDSFFFIFFFVALIFLPKEGDRNKYLFYLFLTISIAAKLYALPALAIFALKYILEKNLKEMKILVISSIPVLILFLVLPIFFWENYLELYLFWNQRGEESLPLFIRILPAITIIILFSILRLKKADKLEIPFVSIVIMASFMFFSNPFVRYFQSLIFYGILTTKKFFSININFGIMKRKICFDNNLLIFYLSFLAVFVAYLMIMPVLQIF